MEKRRLVPLVLAAVMVAAYARFAPMRRQEAESPPPCSVEEICLAFEGGACRHLRWDITLPDGTEFVCLQNERGADWYCWNDIGPEG